MLWFCAGTAGELIKLFPLIRLAQDRALPWFFVCTGQSSGGFWKQWDDFKLDRTRTVTIAPVDRDLHNSQAALRWFTRAALTTNAQLRQALRQANAPRPNARDIWMVHGDTLSTLIGSIFARRLGLPIAHIEAGLRSSHLFSPFPEEICRRMVSRLASFHFVQDERARDNLIKARVHGEVILTHGNTLLDAVQRTVQEFPRSEVLPSNPFAVANIHRFENLHSKTHWQQILDVLCRLGSRMPTQLVLHPPTLAKLEAEPESKSRLENAGVQLIPRQSFTKFVHRLIACDIVVSDGGSNQEECSYLGKPCLILRKTTERFEGLDGGSCLLSRFDPGVIQKFIENPSAYQRAPLSQNRGSLSSPSEIILNRFALGKK